jgi:hypothetical protein
MNEVMVIFSLASAGCLVRLATDLALQHFARKAPSGTIASGPCVGHAGGSKVKADPVFGVGLTLTCYGAIALALVSELPGALGNQRTCLAFALFCVGGLIGEIARTGNVAHAGDRDAGEAQSEERTPKSIGLSVALMLTLNLAVAVFASGQGLIQIVPPPPTANGAAAVELEQIVVVARRGSDEHGGSSTFL